MRGIGCRTDWMEGFVRFRPTEVEEVRWPDVMFVFGTAKYRKGKLDYSGATAIALLMLIISFLLLLVINIVQVRQSRRTNNI